MGFPYDQATWDVVDGAMYMGAGGGMPAFFTWISIAACIVMLWLGNRGEHALYEKYK